MTASTTSLGTSSAGTFNAQARRYLMPASSPEGGAKRAVSAEEGGEVP